LLRFDVRVGHRSSLPRPLPKITLLEIWVGITYTLGAGNAALRRFTEQNE